MNDKDLRTQLLAVFLILSASIAIGVGQSHNWQQLVTFALTFGGAGVGILTGQRLATAAKTEAGDINLNPAPPTQPSPTEAP